eukprot:CAMPEP_0174844010 /NCGR_PEP_ID=MMETSP1114-20130205/10861_1 /TAXON_ID=312471 /ORGANISM="Neobodo designis, Strain CCAP 1951/1" /LENGTH=197 /DNA_ID=CAMNT_0016078243 /DNA_START=63 /DNA_END=653 /DNA_ORIENTATION=+
MATFYERAWSERVASEAKALAHRDGDRRSSSRASSRASSAARGNRRPASRSGRSDTAATPGALLAQLPPRPASRTHADSAVPSNRSGRDAASVSGSLASSVRRHERNTGQWVKSLQQPPPGAVGSSVLPPARSVRSMSSGTSVFSATSLPSRPSTLAVSGATTYRERIHEYEAKLKENSERMTRYEREMQVMRERLE